MCIRDSTTSIPIGESPALSPFDMISSFNKPNFFILYKIFMNIRLYHPNSIVENTTELLTKEHTHYVVNVMRFKRGSRINFFNKDGEWQSEIIFLNKDRVEVKFLEKIKKTSSSSKIELAICLVKKNPMEIILQKATELGVTRFAADVGEPKKKVPSFFISDDHPFNPPSPL